MSDQHLGDGVYASFDGYQIWLAVNDHRRKVVAIDRRTFENLIQFGVKYYGPQIVDPEERR